jgi:hypothetical protein
VRSGFVAFNTLAHVLHRPPNAARSHESDDPGLPKTGVVGDRAMSVSELKQIISAFVIVCGVLAAMVMAM